MYSETLTFLLQGGHVNMPERIEHGLWPHPALEFSDVVRHLARILESGKWFPREWQSAVPSESIWEGGVIERKGRWLYLYSRATPKTCTTALEEFGGSIARRS